MIDHALRWKGGQPWFEPVGVWVQGPGPGLDVVMEYVPGGEAEEEAAAWVINRLVEGEYRDLPPDFLEYHQQSRSPYTGSFGPIVETMEFASTVQAGRELLARLEAGRLVATPGSR